jgi:octaprenyl-diphosphate synthase
MDISHVYTQVQNEIELLNTKLQNEGNSKYKLVEEMTNHIISKGKRIRPILLFLIAKAFEVINFESTINSAFAIELIHTASLLHDDVVDDTKKRRGKRTANTIWGNKEAILVGDYLFTQAFLTISNLQNHQATQILARASSKLTIGEISQLENEQNANLSKNDYIDIIYCKTASLFEASAKLGALFAKNGDLDSVGNFGRNIGIAFQIMDDILDYTPSNFLNKDIGSDFKEKKVTLPIILLLENDFSQKQKVRDHFSQLHNSDLNFDSIINILHEQNIFEKCNNFMEKYIFEAKDFVLKNIVEDQMQKILSDLIDFFTYRKH